MNKESWTLTFASDALESVADALASRVDVSEMLTVARYVSGVEEMQSPDAVRFLVRGMVLKMRYFATFCHRDEDDVVARWQTENVEHALAQLAGLAAHLGAESLAMEIETFLDGRRKAGLSEFLNGVSHDEVVANFEAAVRRLHEVCNEIVARL